MMRRKLVHRMKEMCGATSRMMKDKMIVGELQVDGTRLYLYLYIFIHRCIKMFAILASQVRCYCIRYLLSFIVTMYWTTFLHELYSNSCVCVHYIEGHFIFVSIIGCHNCSYSAILSSFLFLQIQFYDTFSLSPSCALDIVL